MVAMKWDALSHVVYEIVRTITWWLLSVTTAPMVAMKCVENSHGGYEVGRTLPWWL